MESGSSREITAAELQAPYGSAGNKYTQWCSWSASAAVSGVFHTPHRASS